MSSVKLISLSACPISAEVATSFPSQAITPRIGSMLPGVYESRILSIEDVTQNGTAIAVDIVHELMASTGQIIYARFRFYAPGEVNALVSVFAGYGLTGPLNVATLGLEEIVTVAPKPNSAYLHIASRQLKSPSAPPVQVASTASTASGEPDSTESDSQVQAGSATKSVQNGTVKRRGGLVARRSTSAPDRPHTPHPNLFPDDDESDDFLEDDLDDQE